MLQYIALASGSNGNCHYFTNGQNGILIDCGISAKQVLSRLAQTGLPMTPIDAVFITHGHSDHIAAAKTLERKLYSKKKQTIPFYISRGTIAYADERCLPQNIHVITSDQQVSVGSLLVEAFAVPHDAPETLAYRVCSDGLWGGIISDLGEITPSVLDKMRTLSIMGLEFNHDEVMLSNGPYPISVKERVLSPVGHLSNRQAAMALRQTISPTLQHLVLIHLSERNNSPSLARSLAVQAINEAGATDYITCYVSHQKEALPLIQI